MAKRKKLCAWLAVAAVLLAVLAIVLGGYGKDLHAGRERIAAIRSRVFKSSQGEMEYLLTGTGPVVLISHGVTGGVDQGLGLAGMYLGEGYRLLCVSRFGYLRSAMPAAPSPELQAETYRELLDFLGIDGAFIIGNSAGGPSAIRFAIGSPDRCRGLILISAAGPARGAPPPPRPVARAVFGSDLLYWSAVRLFARSMVKMFVPRAVWNGLPGARKRELIRDVFLSALPISRRTRGILFDTYVSNFSLNDELPYEKITSPALIIHAEDDPGPPVEGARRIAAGIAGSELVTYATGGHLILGHEGDIRKKIREFISGTARH